MKTEGSRVSKGKETLSRPDTTVPPPVGLQLEVEAGIPQVLKELSLLFLGDSEELVIPKDPQSSHSSGLLEVTGHVSPPPPLLFPSSSPCSMPQSLQMSTTQSSQASSRQWQAAGHFQTKSRGPLWDHIRTVHDDPQ